LLRAHPSAHVEDNTMLEKTSFIKDFARPSRNREKEYLPIPEILKTRLTELTQELVKSRTQVKHFTQFLTLLREHLDALVLEPEAAPVLVELRQWIEQQLAVAQALPEPQAHLMAKDTFLRIMAAHVKLIPSGHEFFVEGSQSILEAALRSGLSVHYGCTSGHCGHCKARLLQGEVWKIRDHDYVLSETEQNMGYMLMCSNTAVTDLTLEAQEALSEDDLPQQEIVAQVHKLTRLGKTLLIVDLQTPKEQSLRFMAGQSITLRVGENGPTGTYPVASCPCDGRNVQLHLCNHEQDALAQWLSTQAEDETPITMSGPSGHFVLRDPNRPLILIAHNEGFAPMKSLIEHAIAMDVIDSIHLYWLADEMGHYMNNLCRSWNEALDYFTYHPLPADTTPTSVIQQCLATCQRQAVALDSLQVFIAGEPHFCATMQQALTQQGLEDAQLTLHSLSAPSGQ